MKYIIVLFALISITACSKKKDSNLIVCGQILDSVGHSIPNKHIDVTYAPTNFSSYMTTLASFMSDNVGDFCFIIDHSFSGKSVTIFTPDSSLLTATVGIPTTAVDSVNVGVVTLKQ